MVWSRMYTRRIVRSVSTPIGIAALSAALVFALMVALRPITPRIAFNDGLGYDGQYYAAAVRAMRGDPAAVLAERPHYAFRPLPVALVAWSGMDVLRGFLLMNVLSLALAGALLALLVLRARPPAPWLAGLAVLWWATLPGGARYALYYPVLIDAIGLAFLMALLFAVTERRPLLFAALLVPALLTRETLIALVPMLWIALVRRTGGRSPSERQRPVPSTHAVRARGLVGATGWAALAAIVGLGTLALVRAYPPIPPAQPFDALFEIRQNVEWFFQNANARAFRFASAWPLALGLLPIVPLLAWRASWEFLRARPEWAYYLISTAALIPIVGGDYDRYFMYLVPVLAALTFGPGGALFRRSPVVALFLTVAHLVVVRFAFPVGTSEEAYAAYNVATMDLKLLGSAVIAAALTIASVALVVVALGERTQRVRRSS